MNSKFELLERFVWHDLPLTALRLTESTCELWVSPFSESLQAYEEAHLSLSGYESLNLDVQGELTPIDQRNLEIYRFDYELHEEGTLSGKLSILPGEGGYWSISFQRAVWELHMTEAEEQG
ncbi:MAG: hypothetical protein ACLFU8_08920 [Anaerolineales bacterium]